MKKSLFPRFFIILLTIASFFLLSCETFTIELEESHGAKHQKNKNEIYEETIDNPNE